MLVGHIKFSDENRLPMPGAIIARDKLPRTVEKNIAFVGRHVHDTELHFRTRVVWPAGSVRRLLHLGTSQATNWVSILVNMAAGLIHRRLKATCPTGVPCFLARREVLGSPSGSPFRMKIETP